MITVKTKNVRIPSHRAPQEVSRPPFGSSFNFRISVLDLEAYDTLSLEPKITYVKIPSEIPFKGII